MGREGGVPALHCSPLNGCIGLGLGPHSSLLGWQGRADTVPADRVRMPELISDAAIRRDGERGAKSGVRVGRSRLHVCMPIACVCMPIAHMCMHNTRVCSNPLHLDGVQAVQDPCSGCAMQHLLLADGSEHYPPHSHQPALLVEQPL